MTSVLIAGACPVGTSMLYRCIHLREQLQALEIEAVVRDWADPRQVDPDEALGHDLIILYRVALEAPVRAMIEKARERHLPVIFDTDDLVFEPYMTDWHRGAQQLSAADKALYDDGVRRYQMTLKACDYVVTATPLLAQLAARYQKPTFVHRNALGTEMLATAEKLYQARKEQRQRHHGQPLIIGYGSGTPTHDEDFQQAVPALLEILARYAHVQLWLAGPLQLPPSLAALPERIRRFPLMSWSDWFDLAANFDINLAPLEQHNIFCRAKSEIKFVEAGALGVPTVATAIDAFNDVITADDDGLLVSNRLDWIGALDSLIADAELRYRLGERARETVLARYSPSVRAAELRHVLDTVLSRTLEPTQRVERSAALPNRSNRQANYQFPNRSDTRRADKREQAQYGNKVEQTAKTNDGRSLAVKDSTSSASRTDPERREAMQQDQFVPLVLNWLVWEPFAGSGGHTNIFRTIKFLVEFGHECHVYILPVEKLHGKTASELRAFVDNTFMVTNAHYHQWLGTVEDADATIATYWKSVAVLEQIPNPGERYYFVQDFEPYFYPMGSEYLRAENTYRRGLTCITLGSWLSHLLRTRYQAKAQHFDFAVETDIYYPRPVERGGTPRIAFYARPSTPRRAYEIGIEALGIVKAQQPNLEIVFFGAEKLTPYPPFPVTHMGILNPHELAHLYAGCDAGLVLSLTNPSLVPFEMMACRCPVVDIRTEQSEILLEHEKTALLADPTPAGIASTLQRLIRDQKLWQQIADAGHRQVSKLTWRSSARQVEAILTQNAPVEKRVFNLRQGTDESSALLWQISELLEAETDNAEQIDALRNALYQALAEKATMYQQLRRLEGEWSDIGRADKRQALTRLPKAMIQVARRTVNEYAPLTLLGNSPLLGLSLTQEPLYQSFRADRSHLRRLELRFDAVGPLHIGVLQITLRAGDRDGAIVFQRTVPAATIYPAIPLRLDFTPQIDSFQQLYTLVIQAGGDQTMHGLAIRRFLFTQHADAQLRRGAQLVTGQLAFQAFYGETKPTLKPPRMGPQHWEDELRPTTEWVDEAATQAAGTGREALRLAARMIAVVRSRGLKALVAEAVSYLQWHLGSNNHTG